MLKCLLDPCSIIRVQTWEATATAPPTVEQALGIAWPMGTGAVACGRADILCTGPTEWLVIAADPNAQTLLQQLDGVFEGSTFRATNASHALARIEIDGANARTVFAKGCALDLDPSRFPPGRCARTRFAGVPVIVRCTEGSTFECIVTSSYRDYLLSWLTDAAAEFSRT
jgi:sarcosine oxidase subunit gamma